MCPVCDNLNLQRFSFEINTTKNTGQFPEDKTTDHSEKKRREHFLQREGVFSASIEVTITELNLEVSMLKNPNINAKVSFFEEPYFCFVSRCAIKSKKSLSSVILHLLDFDLTCSCL